MKTCVLVSHRIIRGDAIRTMGISLFNHRFLREIKHKLVLYMFLLVGQVCRGGPNAGYSTQPKTTVRGNIGGYQRKLSPTSKDKLLNSSL